MYRPTVAVLAIVSSISSGLAAEPNSTVATTRALASSETTQKLQLVNVELSAQGTLDGQVIDVKGKGLSGVTVAFRNNSTAVKVDAPILVTSDSNGRFRIPTTLGAVCLLQVGDDTYPCRAWKHGTAPPKSVSEVALVMGDEPIVRGQSQRSRIRRLSSGQKYGIAVTALGGVAAYMALSRDNVSE